MKSTALHDLIGRVQNWPETAQDELLALADQIESELYGGDYVASSEELRMIDAAIASIDGGDIATEAEVEAVFAKFGAV